MISVMPAPATTHTLVFDFDGVFTDNKVWVDQKGRESVRCDRSDGLALDLIRAYQRREGLALDMLILSREPNPVVLRRAEKLKLQCHHGIGDKGIFLEARFAEKRPNDPAPFSGMIYLGNDLNDLPVISKGGYIVAPSDAHPAIREVASLVLSQRGGEGFVRAFVEIWLGIDRLSLEKLNELISDC